MSAEFPREELESIAATVAWNGWKDSAATIAQAILAYDQLSERLVMDATEASLEIGKLRLENVALRARLAALEPTP